MDFDLEAFLTLAAFVTGIVWLLDALLFARKRRLKAEGTDIASVTGGMTVVVPKKRREPIIVEYAKSFFPVFLIVLLLRTFVVEPFHVPSSSMVPTLLVGDFILVNKFDYGLRLPVIHTKVLKLGEPQRGDVAVFHYPEATAVGFCEQNPACGVGGLQEVKRSAGTDYVKRIIGIPGDHIVYRGETLYINGVKVPDKALGLYSGSDMMGAVLHQEKLDDMDHDLLIIPGAEHNQGEWTVPAGKYFVMGDNRDNSFDSRYWGFVPEQNLVGRAFFIWMNWDAFHNAKLWHRIGDVIH
ncbi:MAG TPA: signal peptidase I [Gammaproteobacteria bacterium]|nr:signal peptidase I [Gammaproteobacteria bacterium]